MGVARSHCKMAARQGSPAPSAGDLAHPPRKIEIERGQAASIMGAQAHLHGLVDIRPFGMMVELFRRERGARHEAEGLAEIAEGESARDRALTRLQRPAFELADRLRDLGR